MITDRLEVGLDGGCRCHGGGSNQNGIQRSSCSLWYWTQLCIYILQGTAVTSHTHPLAVLKSWVLGEWGGRYRNIHYRWHTYVCIVCLFGWSTLVWMTKLVFQTYLPFSPLYSECWHTPDLKQQPSFNRSFLFGLHISYIWNTILNGLFFVSATEVK